MDADWLMNSGVFCFTSCVLGVLVGKFISQLWFGDHIPPSTAIDIEDIKIATLKISDEFVAMQNLINLVREEHKKIESERISEFEQIKDMMENVTVTIEEAILRNDARFNRFKNTVEAVQENIILNKNLVIKSQRKEQPVPLGRTVVNANVDTEIQGDRKVNLEVKKNLSSGFGDDEYEGPQLIAKIKECVLDILKDATLQLAVDREEENREIQIIFEKLDKDREAIIDAIAQTFESTSEQTKKNFEQYRQIGQHTLHSPEAMNSKTMKTLKTKLDESDARMAEISRALVCHGVDIDLIKTTLHDIDGQFNDMFKKITLGCLQNTENCDTIAENLEKVSRYWQNGIGELGGLKRDLRNDVEIMNEMLIEMQHFTEFLKQERSIYSTDGEKNETFVHGHSDVNTACNEGQSLAIDQCDLSLMCSMIKDCLEILTSMNSVIQDGCNKKRQLHCLTQKLSSEDESAEKRDTERKTEETGEIFDRRSDVEAPIKNDSDTAPMETVGNSGDSKFEIRQSPDETTRVKEIQKYTDKIRRKELEMIGWMVKKVVQEKYQKPLSPDSLENQDCSVNAETAGTDNDNPQNDF